MLAIHYVDIPDYPAPHSPYYPAPHSPYSHAVVVNGFLSV